MVFSGKADNPKCAIKLDGEELQQTENFEYLGCMLTTDGKKQQRD